MTKKVPPPNYGKSARMVAFATAIKKARQAKGWSQRDLMEALGCADIKVVQNLEQGRIGTTLFRVFQICDVLGIEINWEVSCVAENSTSAD